MPTWAKGTTRAALLTASFVALGAGTVFPSTAYADTTSGQSSILGGNQVNLPINAPVDVSGNAVTVGGRSNAKSKGGAKVVTKKQPQGAGQRTNGKYSIGGGNQINAPINAPINVCGNAVAIFGTADAGCKGGAAVINASSGGGGQRTNGQSSILGGNQINAPINAPINICGNSVAVFGDAVSGCQGGAKVINKEKKHQGPKKKSNNKKTTPKKKKATKQTNTTQRTNGMGSIGGGNQLNAPIALPINVCGNAVAVLGRVAATCHGGAQVIPTPGTKTTQQTNGMSSILGGNQLNAPISAALNVCGNAVVILGRATAACEGTAVIQNGTGIQRTNGSSGLGGGNHADPPVKAPVDGCANSLALLGHIDPPCGMERNREGAARRTANHDTPKQPAELSKLPVKGTENPAKTQLPPAKLMASGEELASVGTAPTLGILAGLALSWLALTRRFRLFRR